MKMWPVTWDVFLEGLIQESLIKTYMKISIRLIFQLTWIMKNPQFRQNEHVKYTHVVYLQYRMYLCTGDIARKVECQFLIFCNKVNNYPIRVMLDSILGVFLLNNAKEFLDCGLFDKVLIGAKDQICRFFREDQNSMI